MELKVTKLEGKRDDKGNFVTRRSYAEYDGRGRYHSVPFKDTPAGKTRVSVSVKGESLWDDFERRTSRPHTLWAGPVRRALIEAGWPKDVKLRWSQKAGCSCPCSPAFFVTGGPRGLDLWVTIEADEPQTDNPDEAARRRAALVNDPTLPVTS